MNESITIAVCDDDVNEGRRILDYISGKAHYPFELQYFKEWDSFLKDMEVGERPYDIVLMDMRLGDQKGVDLVRMIENRFAYTQFIFLSNYMEDAQEVFEVRHSYFVHKDNMDPYLDLALKKAISSIDNMFLFFNFRKESYQLPVEEITYLERNLRITEIHTKFGITYQTSEPLHDMIQRLPYHFSMCNRSFVVNFHHVSKISRNSIVMSDGMEISLSNTYRESFRWEYGKYMRELSKTYDIQ